MEGQPMPGSSKSRRSSKKKKKSDSGDNTLSSNLPIQEINKGFPQPCSSSKTSKRLNADLSQRTEFVNVMKVSSHSMGKRSDINRLPLEKSNKKRPTKKISYSLSSEGSDIWVPIADKKQSTKKLVQKKEKKLSSRSLESKKSDGPALEESLINELYLDKLSLNDEMKEFLKQSREPEAHSSNDMLISAAKRSIERVIAEFGTGKSNQLLNSNVEGDQITKKKNCKSEYPDNEKGSKQKDLKATSNNTKKEKDPAMYRFPDLLNLRQLEVLNNFGVVVSGEIRINRTNHTEAFVTVSDTGQDIVIKGIRDRNRALNGDEVYVLIKPNVLTRKDDVLQCGVVSRIKTFNHNRWCIGTLSSFYNSKKKFATLIPNDLRLPRVKINAEMLPPEFINNPLDFQDDLFACRIVNWNNMKLAEGDFLSYLGKSGCAESETKGILLKFDLDVTPYPNHFRRFYPSCSFTIPEEEIIRRTDLRKRCVFTIDPATAKDLDDAVSCEIQPNGNYLIGVHIADVGYFLTEGTHLDSAVSKRATTVYLVNDVYHMLPRDLCWLCSLSPGADKLTFSVFWEFTPEGEILSVRFEKSLINSCAQFAYEEVQGIIDCTNPSLPTIENGHTVEEIEGAVKVMHMFAQQLRRKRMDDGSLTLNNIKISFVLDPLTGLPTSYFVQNQLEAHQLIEEFMLLANRCVATKLLDAFPEAALLRCHSPPQDKVLLRLQKKLEVYGIHLDITSSKTLQSSLQYICEGFNERGPSLVVYQALTKPMVRALYFCSQFRDEEDRNHYALSFPLYTHFTSPIRRYADIIVHRQLAAALNVGPALVAAPSDIQRMAAICNEKKYNAKLAGDDSVELFFSIYVGNQESYVSEAVVSNVLSNFFDCILKDNGISIKIHFANIDGKVKRSEENGILQAEIEWKNGAKQIIEIFTNVTVVLTRGKGVHVDATLVSPISSSSSPPPKSPST